MEKPKHGGATIFVNLDKEKYWLVWTDKKYKVWNFEHNSLSNVPNRDYDIIRKVLSQNGYKYYAD